MTMTNDELQKAIDEAVNMLRDVNRNSPTYKSLSKHLTRLLEEQGNRAKDTSDILKG